jgi:hypothetical protein
MSSTPNSEQLARLRELVTSDPEIMRRTPVFKGTRIPVGLVADMLAQGATAEKHSKPLLLPPPTFNRGTKCSSLIGRVRTHVGIWQWGSLAHYIVESCYHQPKK